MQNGNQSRRIRSTREREEVFLILLFRALPALKQCFEPPIPHIQVHADFILEHPPEDRVHIVKILHQLAEESSSLFGLEFAVGQARHIAENGPLRAGNQKWFFLSGYVDLGPSAGPTVFLDGTKAHDFIGSPILPIAEMDHSALLDLQCRLQP